MLASYMYRQVEHSTYSLRPLVAALRCKHVTLTQIKILYLQQTV
jgi:hypothetical protein